MADPQTLLCGTKDRAPGWIPLRAGPLTMEFDPENLSIRYVRLGEREILRSIYGAVRDRNWCTAPPRVSNLVVDSGDGEFRLTFDANCRHRDIDFTWKGTVTGERDGSVRFVLDGQANSTFLRSRIGLCVLHPLDECAGMPCSVEHVDGTREDTAFPKAVAPWQPFKQVRALVHTVLPGVGAEVRFEGDTFETEDQRNWTDASFKTYSTPLDLPYPVEVVGGTRVRQEVWLALQGGAPVTTGVTIGVLTLAPLLDRAVPMPPIGLCRASHGQPLAAREVQRLRALGLSHLRVDLRLCDSGWIASLRGAASEAAQLGAGLHIALHLTNDAERELDALATELAAVRPRVLLWMIFHVDEKVTSQGWFRLAQSKLQTFNAEIPFAAGTNAYFAELNRDRPPSTPPARLTRPFGGEGVEVRVSERTPLPCYSINPQVHAVDRASLVENVGGQADTVETAFEFSGQPPVVSPVTLRPRFNPNATDAGEDSNESELQIEVDPRQMSLFGAGWTLGSVAQLSCTGHVHSLTYYETTGWRGVMETLTGSPLPERFCSIPGAVFPVFHMFADLAGCSRVCPLDTAPSLSITGLGLLDSRNNIRILIANLRQEPRRIRLRLPARHARIRILDADNAERAMREPESFRAEMGEWMDVPADGVELLMEPCAIARLDYGPDILGSPQDA